MSAKRASLAWLVALGFALGGCASKAKFDKAAATRVTASAAPVERTERVAPYPEQFNWSKLLGLPPEEFRKPNNALFAEAREAYWSRDTARATELLRKLRGDEGIEPPHYHLLFLQCFERDGRWTETLPLYAELGIEDSRKGWREHAEMRMQWPKMEVAFAPGETVVPCTLWRDELVIVEIDVDGTKGRALLDTGAEGSWLSAGFAARAGLERTKEKATITDSNNRARDAGLVRMRELRLGGLTARNVTAAAGSSLFFASQIGVDGIVGWDVLQHAHLVFDFPRREVRVSAPEGGVVAEPNLGGRIGPIFFARSTEGRPLHLFYDSGMGSSVGGVDLYVTDGLIDTKVPTGSFRRRWWPNVGWGLHSMRVHWPRKRSPFTFWLAGYNFETPVADLENREEIHDGWSYLDGVIGNASFLSGRLTLCGVRRLVAFEPTMLRRERAAAVGATGN